MAYDNQHFSPVFANEPWANEHRRYTSYYRDVHLKGVRKSSPGRKQWGRQRRLWPLEVELALNKDLEGPTAPIYRDLVCGVAPVLRDRVKWAQFLLSQVVRTPTFIRYEQGAKKLAGIDVEVLHDRVGCEHCGDLVCVTARRWCLLVADEADYFVRTDNPVHLTGFVEREASAIYYPLSPHVCFVACPLVEGDLLVPLNQESIPAWPLPKGGAWRVNFYLAKHADISIVLRPDQDSETANAMFGEVLGKYPQPPFSLHAPESDGIDAAFESVRLYQSAIDGLEYPAWSADDLERVGADLLSKVLTLESDEREAESEA
ncbi:MAG: hypothetical protein R3F20_13915 [Planctomycetota bacterium]